MYENIILAIGTLFLVIGIVTVVSFILIKMLRFDKNSRFYIVSVFNEEDKDVTVRISCVISILTLLGFLCKCKIIAVDDGIDKEEKENLCAAFSRENSVKVCRKDELYSEIFSEDENLG